MGGHFAASYMRIAGDHYLDPYLIAVSSFEAYCLNSFPLRYPEKTVGHLCQPLSCYDQNSIFPTRSVAAHLEIFLGLRVKLLSSLDEKQLKAQNLVFKHSEHYPKSSSMIGFYLGNEGIELSHSKTYPTLCLSPDRSVKGY